MIIDGYKINQFTRFSEEHCSNIYKEIAKEFGEIGEFLIEEDEVGFRVYRGCFENAPRKILVEDTILKLIHKSSHNFSLGYKIINRKLSLHS